MTRSLRLESLEDRRLLAFNVVAEYAAAPSPTDAMLAYLDGDTQLDLVTGGDAVVVRLGNPDGSFGASQETAASGRSLAAGDLTGDGVTDVVTTGGYSATLLVGHGDGAFQTPQTIALPDQIPPSFTGDFGPLTQAADSVAVGDLNGDGKLDLVVGSHTSHTVIGGCGYYGCNYYEATDSYIHVLLGNGVGAFSYADADPSDADLDAHHIYSAAWFAPFVPVAVAVEDLNGDGHGDVIAAENVGPLSVLLGDGTGALGARIHSGSGYGSASISLGDLDGDGFLDTVLRGYHQSLIIHKGEGDGTFAPSTTISLGQSADSAVIGDVNADGTLDLAAVGQAFHCTSGTDYYGYYYCTGGEFTAQSSVLLGDGQGTYSLPITASLKSASGFFRFPDVALADLTGDGLPELATIDGQASVAIIAENDGNWAPPPELSISDASVVEGHDGTANAVFIVTLMGDASGPVSVDFRTLDYNEGEITDYEPQSGTLSFEPGVFRQTITVPVHGDRLGEGDEMFFVHLANPTNVLIKDGEGVGTILDDEPRISIDHPLHNDPLTVIEGDEGTTPAVFTVTLSAPYDQEVTLDYYTLTGHTDDIIPASGTLRFAPGETSKMITVEVVGDLIDEDLEAFNVILSNPSPNASIAVGGGYCYIEDDDTAPPTIAIGDASIVEGNSGTKLMTFTVNLSHASEEGVWVNYATANGSATTSNNDYVAKSGTLYFAPGETTNTITVSIQGDTKKEKDERFYVNLSGAVGGEVVDSQGVGTILNDDKSGAASKPRSKGRPAIALTSGVESEAASESASSADVREQTDQLAVADLLQFVQILREQGSGREFASTEDEARLDQDGNGLAAVNDLLVIVDRLRNKAAETSPTFDFLNAEDVLG